MTERLAEMANSTTPQSVTITSNPWSLVGWMFGKYGPWIIMPLCMGYWILRMDDRVAERESVNSALMLSHNEKLMDVHIQTSEIQLKTAEALENHSEALDDHTEAIKELRNAAERAHR